MIYFVNKICKNMIFNYFFTAIHLVKRSMRNKQKHGLEDYEQVSDIFLYIRLCCAIFY